MRRPILLGLGVAAVLTTAIGFALVAAGPENNLVYACLFLPIPLLLIGYWMFGRTSTGFD